jgi:hypothetical protein
MAIDIAFAAHGQVVTSVLRAGPVLYMQGTVTWRQLLAGTRSHASYGLHVVQWLLHSDLVLRQHTQVATCSTYLERPQALCRGPPAALESALKSSMAAQQTVEAAPDARQRNSSVSEEWSNDQYSLRVTTAEPACMRMASRQSPAQRHAYCECQLPSTSLAPATSQ